MSRVIPRVHASALATLILVLLGALCSDPATVCQGANCCPEGFASRIGSAGDDHLKARSRAVCLVGLEGNDRLRGGPRDDVAIGGPGDDDLQGGPGDDFLLPGPGADTVKAGPGDDTVSVLDRCEMAAGEILRGGPGYDVLVLPVSEALARAAGVEIREFEKVHVEPTRGCESECSLPCSRIVPGLAGLPDPVTWSVEAGVRYRRATLAERIANNWIQGAFLVEADAFLGAVTAGAERATLLVPAGDDDARTIEFELRSTHTGITFVERRFTPRVLETRALAPTLYEYVTAGLDYRRVGAPDGALMRLISGTDGGVYAGGVVAGVEINVDGGRHSWRIDEVVAPGDPIDPTDVVVVAHLSLGSFGGAQADDCENFGFEGCNWLCAETFAPCEDIPETGTSSSPLHCANSEDLDNDDDGKTDSGDPECLHHPTAFPAIPDPDDELPNATWGCDTHPGVHRHRWEGGDSFALMGEGRFCSVYQANWPQRMTATGWAAAALLNEAVGTYAPADFVFAFDGENRYRYVAAGCWVFDGTPAEGLVAATECNEGGACAVPDAGEYPYAGADQSSSGYYNKVWRDVEHGAAHGLNDVISIAHVIYWGGVNWLDDIDIGADPPIRQLECSLDGGTACCGAAPTGSISVEQRGTGITQYEFLNYCGEYGAYRTVAHEIGHAAGLDHEETTLDSFMSTPAAGSGVLFDALNRGFVWGCLEDWQCPRPSGFRWSGD